MQALENLARANPRPCEAARALQTCVETRRAEAPDADEEDLRRAAGVACSMRLQDVNRALVLLDLPEAARELVDAGALTPGHGRQLARLMPEHDAHCTRLARAAVAGGWAVGVLAETVAGYLGEEAQGDLFGGAVGGFAVGVFLLPILGIGASCILLAALKGMSILCMASARLVRTSAA